MLQLFISITECFLKAVYIPCLMRVAKYIAAGFLGLAATAASCTKTEHQGQSKCNGTEVSDICFGIGHSRVVDSYSGNPGKVFALVYEMHPNEREDVNIKHNTSKIQTNVFLTLEELLQENNAHFVAVENYVGEMSHATVMGNRRTTIADAGRYAEIASLPYEERRERIMQGLMKKSMPEIGSIIFEMMYQGVVFTFGMDDARLHTLSLQLEGKEWEEVAVTQRSHAFLENVFEYLDKDPDAGNVIAISTGLMHRAILEEALRKKGISYIALAPDGLDEAVRKLFDAEKAEVLLGSEQSH